MPHYEIQQLLAIAENRYRRAADIIEPGSADVLASIAASLLVIARATAHEDPYA